MAPASAASRPTRLTPPEVPRSTGLPVVIKRGEFGLSTPSSVAQVSALAAASAAVAPSQGQVAAGKHPCITTKTPARPPFASTCPASRRVLFENFSSNPDLRLFATLDRTLEDVKKTSSRIDQSNPPNPKISVPSKTA